MKKQFLSTTGLLLALVLFLVFNILASAGLKSTQVDLTEDRLYTLSEGTTNLLGKLEEPIKLRLFFSKKVATEIGVLHTYAQRVQELLEQYAVHSRGRITLEVIDPQPYTDEEDLAVGFGLRGQVVNRGGETLYFGLVGTNSTDQEEIIPVLQESKEDSLEYDVTRMIYTLSNPKKRVVGLMTTLPMEGNPMARFTGGEPSEPWFLLEAMRQMFEVKTIAPTAQTIDADVDVLMIVHPQGIAPATQYAIDQYVLRGGKVLAFVDPHCESQQVPRDPSNPMSAMMANRSSDLGPLLAAWGLQLPPEDIAGDLDSALPVNTGSGVPTEYVVYMGLRGDPGCFSKEDFVSSKLGVVNMGMSGVLSAMDGSTTTVTPLIQTTKNSMRINRSSIQFGPDPAKLRESFVSSGTHLMLAARVTGPAKTAFPDGKPAAETPEDGEPKPEEDATSLKEAQEINVIVVADCDMLQDNFWTRVQNIFGQRIAMPMANNADFVINALDNLSGSNDLISLRSRGTSVRPFEKVAEIRQAADTRYGQKVSELEAKLKDAQDRIDALEGQKEGATAGLILSAEQQQEVEKFREERGKVRKELREIKHDRDKDIDALGGMLKFVNIFMIPFLLIFLAIFLALMRWSRAKSAANPAGARS